MKRFFKSAGVFIRSFPKVLCFELLFKLILTALGVPLLSFMLKIAMNSAGVTYLSTESMGKFLLNPLTWIIVLITLFTIAFFSFAELSALTACFTYYSRRKKITALGMFKIGLHSFSKAFRKMGILHFFGFMLIVPFVQLTISSGVFLAPFQPMLKRAMISYNDVICVILFAVLQLILIYFLASRCYSFHFLVMTDSSYPESLKKSRRLLSEKRMRTALEICLCCFMLLILIAGAAFLMSFLAFLIKRGFSNPDAAFFSALKALRYAGKIFAAISSVISAPVILCFITSRFIADTDNSERLVFPDAGQDKTSKPLKITAALIMAAVSVFLNFSYIQGIYKGNISFNVGIFGTPQTTAHRGYSHVAPENTSYSFEAAINAGADYMEFDVQQSADGQLIVIHDSRLERTTNGKGNVSDFTYDELSELSAGSWYKKGDFSDARIMLLSEVIELADNDIMMNIEIKETGNAVDTARKAAELLVEYGKTDSCYVTSFSYHALKAVKKVNSSIKTGLITNIASSAVYSQLKYIDAVSLNYLFVNQNIVSSAHKNGKKVFVWTVNSQSDMEQMIALGVDNIITDRPDIAAETIYSYGRGDFAITVIKKIFGT